MPTLYVENVPDDLYEAVRARAQAHGKSIAAEVIALLGENVPTPAELDRRRKLLEFGRKARGAAAGAKAFPSAEQLQREDRRR